MAALAYLLDPRAYPSRSTLRVIGDPHPSTRRRGNVLEFPSVPASQKPEFQTVNSCRLEGRLVVRCGGCGLNQWGTGSGDCRRCGVGMSGMWVERLERGLEQRRAEALAGRERAAKRRDLAGVAGLLLRAGRQGLGLTAKAAAGRAGVGRLWVHRAESGNVSWGVKNLERAARVMGVPTWVFVDLVAIAAGERAVLG